MKKADIIIICALLAFGLIFSGAVYFTRDKGEYAVIKIDGEEYKKYPLSEDITETVKTEYGENTIQIKNGEASVICADCKNQICVNTHSIKNSGETITCLPHRLTVTVSGEGLDFIS